MTKENKEFVYEVFTQKFMWMEAENIEALYDELGEEIEDLIDDVKGDDVWTGDVCIAMQMALFGRLGIELG